MSVRFGDLRQRLRVRGVRCGRGLWGRCRCVGEVGKVSLCWCWCGRSRDGEVRREFACKTRLRRDGLFVLWGC